MTLSDIAWQSVGGIMGVLAGREGLVISLKQRRLSLDAGLNWPWEWADAAVLRWWALGLGFGLFFVILLFGWEGTLLGFAAGWPLGYLMRRVWKIDESMPKLETEEYTGD